MANPLDIAGGEGLSSLFSKPGSAGDASLGSPTSGKRSLTPTAPHGSPRGLHSESGVLGSSTESSPRGSDESGEGGEEEIVVKRPLFALKQASGITNTFSVQAPAALQAASDEYIERRHQEVSDAAIARVRRT